MACPHNVALGDDVVANDVADDRDARALATRLIWSCSNIKNLASFC